MKRTLYLILAVIFTLIFSSLWLGCGKKAEVVAKVENLEITTDEFREVLVDQFKTQDLSLISLDNKLKTLNELIDQRLKMLKAIDLGLDKDPDFVRTLEYKENTLIAQKLYEKEVVDKLVPEELLNKYLQWQRYDVQVAYVVVSHKEVPGYNKERTREEALKRAEMVVKLFKESDNPEAIPAKYSDDPAAKSNRGILNPYPIGKFNVQADEQVFSANPGDVVGPIEYVRGYLVFKILSKKPVTGQASQSPDVKNLKRQLFNNYFAREANELYQKLNKEFKQKYNAEVYKDNLKQFYDWIQEWAKSPQHKDSDFTEEQRSLMLAKIGDKKITVGYFIDQFGGKFYKNYYRYNRLEMLEQVLDSQVGFLAWVSEGRERGLHKDPEVRKELEKFKVSQLALLLDRRAVRDKVEVSDEEIRTYYEQHKDKYKEPKKIRIWEIAVKSKDLAEKIARQARQGANFESLAEKYTEKSHMQKRRGDLGYQAENSGLGLIVQKAFEAGPNQIVGPFKYGIYYYVLKTGDLKPEQQKPLEQVEGLVRSEIRRQKEKALRDELMREIRKEYVYRINDSIVRRMT